MKFTTKELTATTILIERDEHVVAGSIARVGDHWHVEILWSGPEGDIVYDAPTLAAALAFVEGVGRGFDA